jgi:lipoprotein signal peptidase
VCEWKKNMPLIDIGFACIISGAISHAYERIFIGHVIDFIYIKYFAILNFADILISIGTVFFIL